MIGKAILTVGAVLALAVPALAVQQGSSGQASGGSGQQPSMGQPPQAQPPQGAAFENKAPQQVIDRLRARTLEYEQAWNKHDVKQMASFYNTNSTYQSASGRTATGKAAIQNLIQQEHSGEMKGSQATLTLKSVRSLAPDIALLDVEQSLTGVQQPESGQPMPTELHVVVVATRQAGTWQVAALRAFPSPSAQMNIGGTGQQQPAGTDTANQGDDTGKTGTETHPPSGSDLPPPTDTSPQPLKR